MTVTLQDWGMITALPLEGRALTGRVERTNWHNRVVALIGDCPPAKNNRTSGVPLPWLLKYRSKCPEDAEPRVVEQYARAYLWYLLTEVVFSNCSGNSAIWMGLDFLNDWDVGYSWGAAGLAYLYRSLDDATQGAEDTSDDGDDQYPTVAYAWDVVRVYAGESKALYKVFSNELDALTVFQVTWRPYDDEREWGFTLNSMCKQDRLLWRCIVPMICVYAVEYHLPQRVAAQVGKAQRTPPAGIVTDTGGYDLHQMSSQKNQSIIDWENQHARYVKEWNEWRTRKDVERKVIDWNEYEDHMLWYDDGIKHRLRLRPQWTTADAEDLFDDASENEAYNDIIRELKGGFREYGPLMNIVSSELNKSIFEASLSSITGTWASENKLRGMVKKFVNKCRKLVGLLSG
nr:protein MAIN-LIKE 1-like [Aegilops tauschii subsp. strangulata]